MTHISADMAARRTPRVVVLLTVSMAILFGSFPRGVDCQEVDALRHGERAAKIDRREEESALMLHLGTGRQKRSESPNCGGCTRKWATQRACFSVSNETVRVLALCKPPVRKRRCWNIKVVHHLVQKCCSGYHAEGIECHIDCGGCYKTNSSYWQYACRKKATYYRRQKYRCGTWNDKRTCTRKVPYTVLTRKTYCCKGYVKERGFCRRDTQRRH